MEAVYRISYYTGITVMRLLHRFSRLLSLLILPLFYLIRRCFQRRSSQPVSVSASPAERRARRRQAIAVWRARWKTDPKQAFRDTVCWPWRAAKAHRRATRSVLMGAAIAVSLLLLVGTVRYWGQTTYALSLSDGDTAWGCVSDETVLKAGTALALGRLQNREDSLPFETPLQTLCITPQSSLMAAEDVCDHLLKESGVRLNRACGIYVNGTLQGVVDTEEHATAMLHSILTESRGTQTGVEASFFEKVQTVEGLYPTDTVLPVNTVRAKLLATDDARRVYITKKKDTFRSIAAAAGITAEKLKAWNSDVAEPLAAGEKLYLDDLSPKVQVLVSGTVQYEVEVPYETKRVADASEYEGIESVRTAGVPGVARVTAKAGYLNGEQISCVITASETVRQPVTKVVAYGTKKISSKKYQGGALATGRFIWPVTCTRTITCYFRQNGGGHHNGIDICCNNMGGEQIVAADGGTVVLSAYRRGTSYSSYGKYIVIDHGGGYQTLYAHCQDLLVKEGDTVRQGQKIATVGRTGYATANHLHYEIHIGGKAVNPLSFY